MSASASFALAEPVIYQLDPSHTYPSFEADHFGGLSIWRGKFNHSSGQVILDRVAKKGSIEVSIQANSIDVGHDELNQRLKSEETLFNVKKYPNIIYKSNLIKFFDNQPTEINGMLTLHSVTKPVTLTIDHFKCIMHPLLTKEICGANAVGHFNRADFGIDDALLMGFNPEVKLMIQVESIRADDTKK